MALNRENFSARVREALAKRASFWCGFQPCGAMTIGPSDEASESLANVGVACHITAASPGGPRYDPSKTTEERSSIENGIWMCQTHAKLIDSDEARFSVNLLLQWKLEAEALARSLIGVQITPSKELTDDISDETLGTLSGEWTLNRLVAHRLRDSINNIRFPIAIFVLRHAPESDKYRLHQYLNSQDGFRPKDKDLSDLLNTVCSPELRAQTSGALTPQGVRWFDWIYQGIIACVQAAEQALIIYGCRADAKLVVGLEKLSRTSNSMLTILCIIERNQGADLYSEVGRNYFKILLVSMLNSEAIWFSYIKEQQEEGKKKRVFVTFGDNSEEQNI